LITQEQEQEPQITHLWKGLWGQPRSRQASAERARPAYQPARPRVRTPAGTPCDPCACPERL